MTNHSPCFHPSRWNCCPQPRAREQPGCPLGTLRKRRKRRSAGGGPGGAKKTKHVQTHKDPPNPTKTPPKKTRKTLLSLHVTHPHPTKNDVKINPLNPLNEPTMTCRRGSLKARCPEPPWDTPPCPEPLTATEASGRGGALFGWGTRVFEIGILEELLQEVDVFGCF